ncbi:MAG: pteridine reductase [Hahellaceae bacterium]|nr:pteridine reductase [Hahellaceae bacterium]MCP5168682.1 pteridine reductase [Hahellaceae bacterium]
MHLDKPSDPPVALITGSAVRLGAEIAKHLHHAGYRVVIHYRSQQEAALALTASLNELRPTSAVAICAALDNPDELHHLASTTIKCWGKLDLLVNNASRFYPTPIETSTPSDWHALMESNVKAPYFLSQYLKEPLASHAGNIINIIDIYSQRPLENHSLYCMSKAALAMMTQSLAQELAPNIRVNGVSPGAILWPSGDNHLTDYQENLLKKVPLQRCGTPADIAKAVMFLAQSDYITGQIISVDGGRTLTI